MTATKSYALIHEWLTPKATGGSELVVQAILEQIDADLYALIDFESTNPDSYLYQRRIGTTFLQHFPRARNGVQKYLPLLPLAIEQLDLRQYDVLLSSSHAVAKGVLTAPHQLHVCYCHTPMRYAWDLTFDYLQGSRAGHGLMGWLTRYLLHHLRQWDVITANRVDYFIANSHHTARRIWRCYRRPAEVIYPPVNLDRFQCQPQKQDFYLTVCRLVPYKHVDIIVEAFNQIDRPLIIIGDGPDLPRLRQMARPHIQFLGAQPNAIVEQHMAQAKAFVYAACEDFGIAPVEAQACGTPVIGYARGGVGETVRDLRQEPGMGTGILFSPQTAAALVTAIETFEQYQSKFSPEAIRRQAERFSPAVFAQHYCRFLERCIAEFDRQAVMRPSPSP
ncbi:glycosyltransferase [Trichothermofontia sichuanensis B231]|uniref:glycosyltransferase n=1 Tax=Trichothermofontia sichuanensis TaxID=3045816 RepID=UPI0022455F2B|nr:glycosyltransferase [Trichothermofontia sichuanensis]UZQ54357.1 glycosyltransferase [Trichothermofontia sichuanensis B231]